MRSVLVVGAGAAGLAAVETLRHEGYDGRLTLVGDEPCLPYDRPPLSKQVLAGTWNIERTRLRDTGHFASLGVELVQGRRAAELDLSDRHVVLDSGERLPFDGLVIATGVTPRRLPSGHELTGVHVLRSERHVSALLSAFANRPRLVVVGAGFLGSEVAATARALGLDVVLVGAQPQPIGGQLGEHIGARVAELHRANGVQVRIGVRVAGLVSASGRVTGVELSDGSLEPADVVLVAIGSTPNVDWLEGSGLTLGDGLLCDEYCGAGQGVYAAGDVASWFHVGYGRRMRLEHRMNATEQGAAAATNLLSGSSAPFVPIPYFWTDHYDTKIQVHGVIPPGVAPVVVEGDLSAERFTVLYQDGGGVHALLTWNNPKSARHYRQELSVVKAATPSTGDNHDRSHDLAPR